MLASTSEAELVAAGALRLVLLFSKSRYFHSALPHFAENVISNLPSLVFHKFHPLAHVLYLLARFGKLYLDLANLVRQVPHKKGHCNY